MSSVQNTVAIKEHFEGILTSIGTTVSKNHSVLKDSDWFILIVTNFVSVCVCACACVCVWYLNTDIVYFRFIIYQVLHYGCICNCCLRSVSHSLQLCSWSCSITNFACIAPTIFYTLPSNVKLKKMFTHPSCYHLTFHKRITLIRVAYFSKVCCHKLH